MARMKACFVLHVLMPSAASVVVVMLVLSTPCAAFRSEDSAEDDYSPLYSDEGSGPDDEDMSYLFTDVRASDVTFRCYRCAGVTDLSGCNVTSLRESPADYLTDCDGHCLNISTVETTVFDCTSNVPVKSAKCFQKDHIHMCVCSTDLCNGPPLAPSPQDVMPLPTSLNEINLTSLHDINMTSTDLSIKNREINMTSERNASATSRDLDEEIQNMNTPSTHHANVTFLNIDITQQQLNLTRQPTDTSRNRTSQLNVTSHQLNITSRQENHSSQKVGVVTSEGRGEGSVVLPETFQQRQENDTVIEAASKSGGDRPRVGPGVVVVGVVTCFCLVLGGRGLGCS